MFVMEIKLNHNLEMERIQNTLQNFQYINISRSTEVIGAFQHNLKYYVNTGDNPTINSSIVRYESNCSHKPRGTYKPTFSSPKGYFPSITSISKI